MDPTLRPPTEADLPAMATLAESCQADPERFCAYIAEDVESITTDVSEIDGWVDTTIVAERDGRIVGWLLAEVDVDMGRLWWWGPFVEQGLLESLGDPLYTRTSGALAANLGTAFAEQEACADDRSEILGAWCIANGLVPETASVLLRRDPGPASTDRRVRPLSDSETDRAAVKILHDLAFPGTHTTADALVASDHPRRVIEVDGSLLGYVAYEPQSDGSGYIDYLAVAESARGQGLGGALVDHACAEMFDAGVGYAHLTVREDNSAARALYARLGFIEQRLARPFRLGFKLD